VNSKFVLNDYAERGLVAQPFQMSVLLTVPPLIIME